jgi:hypothetical protein
MLLFVDHEATASPLISFRCSHRLDARNVFDEKFGR